MRVDRLWRYQSIADGDAGRGAARVIGALLVIALCSACGRTVTNEEVDGMVIARPVATDEVLINPGAGWQLLVSRAPEGEMSELPLVSTYYYRGCWTEFEPTQGAYEGSPAVRIIDAWLAEAARQDRYVAIRVVPWNSENPDYQRVVAQKVQGYAKQEKGPAPDKGPARLFGERGD